MTHNTDVIDQMVGLIEPALSAIEQERGESELRDLQALLRELLADFIGLIERHPGVEAATADLYAAAAALVRDNGAGSEPSPRKLRLFREARRRFHERLTAARPRAHTVRSGWRHQELLLSA